MTNQQRAPEALRLADKYAAAHAKWALEDLYGGSESYTAEMLAERHAARERLAAALVEAQQPATHVQQSAEIEHVANDVSKNGPESNMSTQQPEPAEVVYSTPEEMFDAILTPQPSPTPQADSVHAPVLDRARIREIFMAHGFTVKEGQTDLKQYVYDAADALLRAARAPADSVTAPAGGAVMEPTPVTDADVRDMSARVISGQAEEDELVAFFERLVPPRPVRITHEADSVLEDAARYEYLRDCTMGERNRLEHYSGPALDVVIDAARKQGANHD